MNTVIQLLNGLYHWSSEHTDKEHLSFDDLSNLYDEYQAIPKEKQRIDSLLLDIQGRRNILVARRNPEKGNHKIICTVLGHTKAMDDGEFNTVLGLFRNKEDGLVLQEEKQAV